MATNNITREQLDAYLDDALSDIEAARVEQQLRKDKTLRDQLTALIRQRDRGEHSLGAVWRREKLSCPGYERLGSYHLKVLDEGETDYIDFHLRVVGCAQCQANMDDILAKMQEDPQEVEGRVQRHFTSSVGNLRPSDDSDS